MKAYTGTVKKSEITKNRDGENDVRMLTIELSEPDDLPTIQLMTMAGDDTCPIDGDEVAIIEVSKSYRIVIACNDPIAPTVDEGERKIYSRDSNGDIISFLYLKNDGSIELTSLDAVSIKVSNSEGFFELKTDGQFNANDNFTVDV